MMKKRFYTLLLAVALAFGNGISQSSNKLYSKKKEKQGGAAYKPTNF